MSTAQGDSSLSTPPKDIVKLPHKAHSVDNDVAGTTPPTGGGFLLPSPVPTRRNRSCSLSERARAGPTHYGRIKSFCREKGHGFIAPHDGLDPIFVHISDVDGELVPLEGDDVSYKRCPMPPKFEKFTAVHVQIIRPKEGSTHHRWDGHVAIESSFTTQQ